MFKVQSLEANFEAQTNSTAYSVVEHNERTEDETRTT